MLNQSMYSYLPTGALYAAIFALLAAMALGAVVAPNLLVLVSILFAVFLLVFLKPLLGLSIVVMSVFLTNIVITVDSPVREANEILHFTSLPILVVYIFLLPRIFQNLKYSDRYERTLIFLITALFGWAIVSFLWTTDRYHGMNVLSTFLVSIFIVHMLLSVVNDRKSLYVILGMMPFLGVMLACLLVASKWFGSVNEMEIVQDVYIAFSILTDHDRPGGFAPPDLASSVMNIFIFINIALMYRAGPLKRLILGGATLFLVLCNFLTASKAGAGSLVIGMVALLFLMPHFRNYIIRLSMALAVFVGALLIAVGGVLIKRVMIVLGDVATQGGMVERLDWWAIGFDKFFGTYGLGLGVGGFVQYIDPVPGAHSFYFSLLFDLGLIGAAIFTVFILVLLDYTRVTLRDCKDSEMSYLIYCFIANIIAFSVQATLEGDFQQGFFWFLYGFMITVLKVARIETKGEDAEAALSPALSSA